MDAVSFLSCEIHCARKNDFASGDFSSLSNKPVNNIGLCNGSSKDVGVRKMALIVLQNQLGVNEASLLQRRLYRAIRETMRAMAGRISGTANWPAKKMLARHAWLDSEHADAIRTRVLELRFPKVDVDQEADKALMEVLKC